MNQNWWWWNSLIQSSCQKLSCKFDKKISLQKRESNKSSGSLITILDMPCYMGIDLWQRVAMDSLKFHLDPHARPLYALQAGHPHSILMAISGVACLQGKQPAGFFYHFGQPTPYASGPAWHIHFDKPYYSVRNFSCHSLRSNVGRS
jgi:hypothetical protein